MIHTKFSIESFSVCHNIMVNGHFYFHVHISPVTLSIPSLMKVFQRILDNEGNVSVPVPCSIIISTQTNGIVFIRDKSHLHLAGCYLVQL